MSQTPGFGHVMTSHLLASVTSSAAPLSSPVLWLTGLERGVLLIGLAVALGGLAGRGVAKNYKGDPPAPLPEPWIFGGVLAGLIAAAALVVTALADPGQASNLAHPYVVGARAHGTVIFAAVEFACFAIAAVLIRAGRENSIVPWLLGVVLAESLRAHPEGMIPLAGALLSICHLLPAVLWAGMLIYVVRGAVAWRADPAAMRALVKLYAAAAGWLFTVVVITGILSVVLLVPLGSLLTTTYGIVLIVKAALVAVAAGLAVAGRMAVRRQAQAGSGPARVTRWEGAALVAVLVVTGLLTVITPPAKSVYSASPASASHAARASHARPADHRRQRSGVRPAA